MKAHLCLYLWLIYQNDVLSLSTSLRTLGLDNVVPIVIAVNERNKGTEENEAQGNIKDDAVDHEIMKPSVKRVDQLYDSKKPLVSNHLDRHIRTEAKDQSENDNEIVNIGDARQPGSIFFNPYWMSHGKKPLHQSNNAFIYKPDNNGYNNYPSQNSIYTGSKVKQQSNTVQIGKSFKSRLWKQQYQGNKSLNKHANQLSGSKVNKPGHTFQIGKSFYSLLRNTLNSTQPRTIRKVPLTLRNSPYNNIHRLQSSTQKPNPGRSGIFSVNLRNKKWNRNSSQAEKPVVKKKVPIKRTHHNFNRIHSYRHDKSNPLRNRIYSKPQGRIEKKPGNQEPHRYKRGTDMNNYRRNEKNKEGASSGQLRISERSSQNGGNLIPARHSLKFIKLGNYSLNAEMNNGGTITVERSGHVPKEHRWNQRDLKNSGNLIQPARHSLSPIKLASNGMNTHYPENLNKYHTGGGRITNHPDEQSNINSGNQNQNLHVERNIHYPDIAGMKIVRPKYLPHYLRNLKVIVEPNNNLSTGAERLPNTLKAATVPDWKDVTKWGGILFRTGSPKYGIHPKLSFPHGSSNVSKDDDGPITYRFHFGGIIWLA